MNLAEKLRNVLNSIPNGKVVTYSYIAEKLKVHPRHAGLLLSKNDSSKAPCYKVVRSDGSLGGYSADGGEDKKIKLLQKEGIEVANNRVDLERFGI